MARSKGTFTFAANFEPLVSAPLDARQRVSSFDDLITPSTWQDINSNIWLYSGLLVSVIDDADLSKNGLYFLADKDNYTLPISWVKLAGTIPGTIDASGTSSSTFQLNDGAYGVVLTDTAGNLTVNTYDGSLASITVSAISIDGFLGAKGVDAVINGDNIVKEFNILHNLNTFRHTITMYDASTNFEVYPERKRGLNTDTIIFTEPPIVGENYEIIIIGF